MSYGLIATLIVLAIVIGAITTKKCEAFLIAGSMVGAIVLWKQDFLTKWVPFKILPLLDIMSKSTKKSSYMVAPIFQIFHF